MIVFGGGLKGRENAQMKGQLSDAIQFENGVCFFFLCIILTKLAMSTFTPEDHDIQMDDINFQSIETADVEIGDDETNFFRVNSVAPNLAATSTTIMNSLVRCQVSVHLYSLLILLWPLPLILLLY